MFFRIVSLWLDLSIFLFVYLSVLVNAFFILFSTTICLIFLLRN